MALENTRIEYCPLRIGFCVRYGNVEDVVAAGRLSTLLWGGAYNPIIPVGAPDDLADELVKVFQVDILVAINDAPEIKAFKKKYEWARFPLMHHSDDILVEDSYKQSHKVSSVLDVSHLIRNLWDKEFKFAEDGKSNCAFISWKAADPHKELLCLLFGAYPKEKLSYPYEKNFKEALRAREIKIDPTKTIPAAVSTAITPIGLTEHQIKSYGGHRGFTGGGIYVGDPKDFTDLVNFWNIRATDAYITFLPKTNGRRLLSAVRAHISRIKSRGDKFGETKAFVGVWYRADGEEQQKVISEAIKPLEHKDRIFGMHNISVHSWNGMNLSASYNILKEATGMANTAMKYGKPNITIHLADKPFAKRDRVVRGQYFVASLNPSRVDEYPEHTLHLPVLPDLNDWYSKEMVFDKHSVRVTETNLGTRVGVITDIQRDALDVNPIPKADLVKRVLERAAIKAEKSGAGLVAERLISLMEGIGGSARIFKITGVRKFINDTDPLHQQTKGEIQGKISDGGSFAKFVGEFGLKGSPLTTEQVFETMLERNLIRAGIEVRCPKCSLKTWISLKEVDEMYSCEFCQEKSKFVETAKSGIVFKEGDEKKSGDGVRWHYRLSGLLGQRDKQQGAIPVILTLQHLANRMHSSFNDEAIMSSAFEFVYTQNGQEKKAESDLMVFDMSQRMGKERLEILIGECKNGQQITRSQIDSLLEVKSLIEKSGIKCHLVFTKLKGGFTASEIGHFKRLVSSGVKPLLFTENELEWWWNEYRNFKAKRPDFKLPYEHPFTFGELAENSAYVYELY